MFYGASIAVLWYEIKLYACPLKLILFFFICLWLPCFGMPFIRCLWFYNGRLAYVLVFYVLVIFLLIKCGSHLKLITLWLSSWKLSAALDTSILCKHPKLSGDWRDNSTLLYCHTARKPVHIRLCSHLFIQWILIVELVSMRHYRADKMNERITTDTELGILQILMWFWVSVSCICRTIEV